MSEPICLHVGTSPRLGTDPPGPLRSLPPSTLPRSGNFASMASVWAQRYSGWASPTITRCLLKTVAKRKYLDSPKLKYYKQSFYRGPTISKDQQ